MKTLIFWLTTRKLCAWCKNHLGGNPMAKRISHGICSSCRHDVLESNKKNKLASR